MPRSLARNLAAAPFASPLEEELLAFDSFGAPTRRIVEEGVLYLVNEFWTSAQRQAHSLHEISYRACFKPQLPGFFISASRRRARRSSIPSWAAARRR